MVWLYDWCFSDVFWLQFFILYNFKLLITSKNTYYSLLYLFVELILLGIFICLYQMELFSGFLWVAEGTVLLVFLILLIYLNAEGFERSNFLLTSWMGWFIVLCVCVVGGLVNVAQVELQGYFITEYVVIWDDFYEALNNQNMNDFSLLFISYYNVNSFEFVLFAILLFVGTMVCVCVFKSIYTYKHIHLAHFFLTLDLFQHKIYYNFLRQQNLHKQGMMPASSRIMRKK